jgi:hypothetical protein
MVRCQFRKEAENEKVKYGFCFPLIDSDAEWLQHRLDNPVCHANADGHCHLHPYFYAYQYAHPYPNIYPNAHLDVDSHAYIDPYADATECGGHFCPNITLGSFYRNTRWKG